MATSLNIHFTKSYIADLVSSDCCEKMGTALYRLNKVTRHFTANGVFGKVSQQVGKVSQETEKVSQQFCQNNRTFFKSLIIISTTFLFNNLS